MSDNETGVLEGFLCPTCMQDLKTQDQLILHVEKQHPEEQDVLQSLKDLVGKAKKKILKLDEHDLDSFKSIIRTRSATSRAYRQFEKQDLGQVTNHSEYYKSVRGTRLEHFATETNKLLIRLDRILNFNNTDRRQHEQSVVQWLDGTSVKLCPSCTKSFNLTRRQHHCRLCGSVMCQVCSCFLSISMAKKMTGALVSQKTEPENESSDEAIRMCGHCLGLLENRHSLQERRQAQPIVCELYLQLRSLMSKAEPLCVLYNKMCESLCLGESTYSLADTQTLRSSLAKQAELIDIVSRKIAALAGTPKEIKLHQSIRRASTIYLKEKLLCLPQLPTQEEIDVLRKSPKTINNENTLTQSNTVAIVTGWSPIAQPIPLNDPQESDPLIVQMDVIRGYIKEARSSLRFEEVALLEENLRELQNEYHHRQK